MSIAKPFANIFNRLVLPGETTPFNLSQLADFPFSDWTTMQEYYGVYIDWFAGKPLNETIVDTKTGQAVERFPIKLNPIPGTCEKHAAVLLGNTLESIREGGLPIQYIPTSEKSPEKAEVISQALNKAFEFAGGGAMFVDAGITSQYMGGCVWRVRFDAENMDYPVQVEYVDPVEFFGIPNGSNHWELHEAWFVREINLQDAKKRGYTWNEMDDRFYYVEHWTPNKVTIFVNDVVLTDEENVFGVVPFIYIPHIRVRGFIGKSLITETVKGIVREWNLRFADVGDAVADDSHSLLAARGVVGTLRETTISDGRKVILLGSKQGIGTNETDPDLIAVNTKSTSAPMITYNQMLEGQYRKESKHPAVADGEDEGSQRSAATLTVRMWPLIAHVELERINWTTGLLKLAKMILRFYSNKGLEGITEDMVKVPLTVKWSTSLPRDREALINELVMRKKNGMSSLRHILEMLGDIVDIDKELQMIEEEVAKAQEAEMKMVEATAAAKGVPGDPKAKGNVKGKNNAEPGDKTDADASTNLKKEVN